MRVLTGVILPGWVQKSWDRQSAKKATADAQRSAVV